MLCFSPPWETPPLGGALRPKPPPKWGPRSGGATCRVLRPLGRGRPAGWLAPWPHRTVTVPFGPKRSPQWENQRLTVLRRSPDAPR